MGANRGFRVLAAGVVMTTMPALAAAQLSARDLPVAVGQQVWVTAADGRVTKGKVLRLTPATIEIGEGETATANLAFEDVRRIRVPDSVTNGVVTGAISVGLAGLLVGAYADAASVGADILGQSLGVLFGVEPEPVKQTNHFATGTVVGAVLGAALGYAIDSGKAKTVYQRDDTGMTVALRPILSNAGRGLGLRVTW